MKIFTTESTTGIESESGEFKFVNKKNSTVHRTEQLKRNSIRFDVKSFQKCLLVYHCSYNSFLATVVNCYQCCFFRCNFFMVEKWPKYFAASKQKEFHWNTEYMCVHFSASPQLNDNLAASFYCCIQFLFFSRNHIPCLVFT